MLWTVQFRYAQARSYEDLASGHVLVSAPGYPAFPVRLASELFSRALAHLEGLGGGRRSVTLWDPCCGSGYLLTTLALLHPEVGAVVATDADPAAVEVARQNLALLTRSGLTARRAHLERLAETYGKESHREAARTAGRIGLEDDMPTAGAVADALDPDQLREVLGGLRPDVVIADVPYGDQTGWHRADRSGPAGAAVAGGGSAPGSAADSAVEALVRSVAAVVPGHAVIVVVDRGRKVSLPGLRPLERLRHGHRAAALLRAGDARAVAEEPSTTGQI